MPVWIHAICCQSSENCLCFLFFFFFPVNPLNILGINFLGDGLSLSYYHGMYGFILPAAQYLHLKVFALFALEQSSLSGGFKQVLGLLWQSSG